jgi:hypothetical protein
MNRLRFVTGGVSTAGPFGGPIALSTRATFPEVKRRSGQIPTGTFLLHEELSS